MTNYVKYSVSLTQGQKNSLRAAINAKRSVTLRLPHNQLSGSDTLMLTNLQIQKINNAKRNAKGVDVKLSKTQLEKTGGALSALLALGLPLLLSSFGKGLQLPGTRGKGLALPGTQGRGLVLPGTRRQGGAVTDAMIRKKAKEMGYNRVIKGSGIWSFIKGLFT